jgi:hypothetical protein
MCLSAITNVMPTIYDPGPGLHLPYRIGLTNYFRLARLSPEDQEDTANVQQHLQLDETGAARFLSNLQRLRRFNSMIKVRAELRLGTAEYISRSEVAERNGGLTSIYTMRDLGQISGDATRVLQFVMRRPSCFAAQLDRWWSRIDFSLFPVGYKPKAATQLEVKQILSAWDIEAGDHLPLPRGVQPERSFPLMQQVLRAGFPPETLAEILTGQSVQLGQMAQAWDQLESAGFAQLSSRHCWAASRLSGLLGRGQGVLDCSNRLRHRIDIRPSSLRHIGTATATFTAKNFRADFRQRYGTDSRGEVIRDSNH